MNISFSFDSSVNSAPAAFTTALNQVASFFSTTFLDPVTVRIAVGWGEVSGQALSAGALAQTFLSLNTYSYSQIRQALSTDAKSSVDASAVASLPASAPVTGQFQLSLAESKAVGLSTSTSLDGSIGFSTVNFDFDNSNGVSGGTYDFFGVAAHEISHVLGWGIALVGQSSRYTLEDLFHFSAPGQRVFTAGTGYFSADNGVTNLGTFNTSGSGDIGAWDSSMDPEAFRAAVPGGVVLPVTANDIKVMDALGWDVASAPSDTTVPTLSSASPADNSTNVAVGANLVLTFSEAVKAGSGNVVLHMASDGSTAASISIGDASQVSISGSAVTINPASDLAAGTHYYVTIDSGAIKDLAGNSFAGISVNSALDFTTAGSTPPATTAIETSGATTLATAANHFYLQDKATGVGPTLKYGGADFIGSSSGWTPIGAEKTATGYEVAFKYIGADLYTEWNADNNGNFTGDALGHVPGSDTGLMSSETLFQQDLNNDGHIGNSGSTTTAVETNGSTTLATAANHFYLQDKATGIGPSLKYGGADFIGSSSGWTPIGAEKTATGYEVAFKYIGADLYTEWNADNNGNFTGDALGYVPGSDTGLMSSETLFQQDLNNDGHIGNSGSTTTAVETNGSTTLATAANHFYLQDKATGTGPTLKYGGADFIGSSSGWTPIGAEKTATGYEVAFKYIGADLYTEWNADNNGNFTGDALGHVPGSDTGLMSSETLFQQDLNNDGHIGNSGSTTTAVETNGSTTLATAANHFYLQDKATGTGPTLKYGGADFIGSSSGWTPIGAEKTATGYEVAFKYIGADLYTEWNADNNGNFTGDALGHVPGSDTGLMSSETLFQQDLNNDGHIGSGLTALASDAGDWLL